MGPIHGHLGLVSYKVFSKFEEHSVHIDASVTSSSVIMSFTFYLSFLILLVLLVIPVTEKRCVKPLCVDLSVSALSILHYIFQICGIRSYRISIVLLFSLTLYYFVTFYLCLFIILDLVFFCLVLI